MDLSNRLWGGHDSVKWWGKWFTRGKPSHAENFGKQLIDVLAECLSSDSARALDRLARACDPTASDEQIASEVLCFHKFLVVQGCAGSGLAQPIMNRMVSAFYAALKESESEISIRKDVSEDMEEMWVTRANQYEMPFGFDLKQYLENPPGHLPWKRTVAQFCQNFRRTPEPMSVFETHMSLSVQACVSVAVTFGIVFKGIGEVIRLQVDQNL